MLKREKSKTHCGMLIFSPATLFPLSFPLFLSSLSFPFPLPAFPFLLSPILIVIPPFFAGILADEMGLGKTMTALALILANQYKPKVPDIDRDEAISQLNSNLDKTWYHLINRNRLVVC